VRSHQRTGTSLYCTRRMSLRLVLLESLVIYIRVESVRITKTRQRDRIRETRGKHNIRRWLKSHIGKSSPGVRNVKGLGELSTHDRHTVLNSISTVVDPRPCAYEGPGCSMVGHRKATCSNTSEDCGIMYCFFLLTMTMTQLLYHLLMTKEGCQLERGPPVVVLN